MEMDKPIEQLDSFPIRPTKTRRRPYELRRLQMPAHPDTLHIFASVEDGEKMAASIVVWPVGCPGSLVEVALRMLDSFLVRSFMAFSGS